MSSMQARWALINKDATKFCTLMDQVHSVPWSGWTNDMYTDKALKLFKEEAGGKSFSFMGCYMILKDAPKWRVNSGYIRDPALYTKKNTDKKNPDKKQAPLERPIGNKAAKAARSLEEKQIEVDMRMAAALETRAKLHKDQLTYKILVQIPD